MVYRPTLDAMGRGGRYAGVASMLAVLLVGGCGEGNAGGDPTSRDAAPTGGLSDAGGDSTDGLGEGSSGCPTALPAGGDACRLPPSTSCEYAPECDGGRSCRASCIGGAWFVSCPPCAPTPDCPSTLPVHGSACADGPTYTCVLQECDVNQNFIAATCEAGVWNVDSRICGSACGRAGEDGPSLCPPGLACVKGPECEDNPMKGCQPNPCSTAPFSCACAAVLCPGSICDSVTGGNVTCVARPRDPSTPAVVAENLDLPGSVALYAGMLYVAVGWRSGIGPVLAIDTKSGATRTIGGPGETAYDVVVDASGVFWNDLGTAFNPGTVRTAALEGGSSTALVKDVRAARLGLDANAVYFTTDVYDTTNPNRLLRVPKSGGTPEIIASPIRAAGFAVAPSEVFFVDRTDTANQGIISLVPSTGGPSTVLATQQGSPSLLALDARRLYWLDEGPPDVKAMARTGGATTTLYTASSGAGTPRGIWLDDTYVYFTDSDTGRVMKVAKDGGPVTTIAQGPPGASGIVADADQVYWVVSASFACGRVLRAHK